MSMEFNQKLKKQLELHEGRVSHMYTDSLGIPTVGVGFNLTRADAPVICQKLGIDYERVKTGRATLTPNQIDSLYRYVVRESEQEVRKYITNYDALSDVRKRVLMDLMYNLGSTKFSMFKTFIKHINAGRFPEAALQLSRSLWFRQVGYRGIRLCAMLLTDIDLIV